ncbi:MAG: SDR family NAD(P)-dependent oxidoreductase [Alphaproteobacteria bacterium]
MTGYSGKYIWIIGASSGIGHALAKELSKRGATLAVSSRNEKKLNHLKQEMRGEDHLVLPLCTTDQMALRNAHTTISETFPRLDSIIFMAALYSAHDGTQKDINFIHEMIDVNLKGAFNITDIAIPFFKEQGSGQIALCGSVAGYRGLPYGQPYCATKAALINYAESLKCELKGNNIDVKIINPGFVRTPLTDKNDFPMPMIIEAEEAANAIAAGLASKAFEIHFPKRFTRIAKIMHFLPAPLYFLLSRSIFMNKAPTIKSEGNARKA